MSRVFDTGLQQQPTLRFWVNPPAVIVGRFQEVEAEVDLAKCQSSQVAILRNRPQNSNLDFQRVNLNLVLEALQDVGVPCSLSPPNSIQIGGRKVCGAAAAIGKRFALWHCSILVHANLELLEQTLEPSKAKSGSRFVHSKWQTVTTLASSHGKEISLGTVAKSIAKSAETTLGTSLEEDRLSKSEEKLAEELCAQKYSSDKWNMRGNLGFDLGEDGDHTTIAV
jgi:lipoate-protein ligase A